MSIENVLEVPVAVDFTENPLENPVLIDQLSKPLVGQWNTLVSQTNWEKGALILYWRNELIAAGQPNTVYSDEAWSRRVGNVTAQHVGRLRRTAERFGDKHSEFNGLYWSHFFVALEWEDAELWLEGAVQNDWSVAQMQVQRWDALGVSDKHKPQDADVILMEIDEDAYLRQSAETLPHNQIDGRIEGHTAVIGSADAVEGFDASSIAVPDSAGEPSKSKDSSKKSKAKQSESDGVVPSAGELLLSLKGISEFPADLAEPLELLKVAILNHQLSGWQTVSAKQICETLDTLKLLTTAQ